MRAQRALNTAAAGLVAMLIAAGVPAAAQVTSVSTGTTADRLLVAQNAERQRLGIKPLVWSAKLAEHARKWAQTLAVSDMFEHSVSAADGSEGENLWFGSKGDFSPEEMIGDLVAEGSHFKRGVFPDVSTTGRWEDVGHYTQLVWQETHSVGCAIATNQRRDILVCRYTPAGNTVGQTVYAYSAPISPPKPAQRASRKRRRGG